jgi:preprotein translocase subunit SecD
VKRAIQAFVFSLALSICAAADSTNPSLLQIRRVLDKPSADSDELSFQQNELNVAKTPSLDLAAVKSASAITNVFSGEPVVDITLTAEGAKQFARLTRENIGRQLAVVVDGKVMCAPIIREPITGGEMQISAHFGEQEAKNLAAKLNAAIAK